MSTNQPTKLHNLASSLQGAARRAHHARAHTQRGSRRLHPSGAYCPIHLPSPHALSRLPPAQVSLLLVLALAAAVVVFEPEVAEVFFARDELARRFYNFLVGIKTPRANAGTKVQPPKVKPQHRPLSQGELKMRAQEVVRARTPNTLPHLQQDESRFETQRARLGEQEPRLWAVGSPVRS